MTLPTRASPSHAPISRVIDFIESNIDQQLTLKKPADVASFSLFHFHRIFGAIVGEPLNRFIQRIRLEKAAIKLAVAVAEITGYGQDR